MADKKISWTQNRPAESSRPVRIARDSSGGYFYEDVETGARLDTPTNFTNATATWASAPDLAQDKKVAMNKSPLSRRRDIGDAANKLSVDTDGYWLHVKVDSMGIPKETLALEVIDNARQWRYVGEEEFRGIDRLSSMGVYVFLY